MLLLPTPLSSECAYVGLTSGRVVWPVAGLGPPVVWDSGGVASGPVAQRGGGGSREAPVSYSACGGGLLPVLPAPPVLPVSPLPPDSRRRRRCRGLRGAAPSSPPPLPSRAVPRSADPCPPAAPCPLAAPWPP